MRFALFLMANLKSTLLFFGGIGLICTLFFSDTFVALREHAPSPVNCDNWAGEYHGQYWIKLSGVAQTKWSEQWRGSVFIPVVGTNYHKGETIHVFIMTRPNEAPAAGPITVEGCDVRHPGMVLSNLPTDSNAIALRPGAKPRSPALGIGLGGLGLLLTLIAIFRVQRSWREFLVAHEGC